MKIRWVLIALMCVCWCEVASAFELDGKGRAAYETLKSAPFFAIGGVGFAGTTSEPEEALRVLLQQKEASAAFQALLKEARIEGQLYALLGLRIKDKKAYEENVAPYLSKEDRANLMRGCVLSEVPADSIAKDINKGIYQVS